MNENESKKKNNQRKSKKKTVLHIQSTVTDGIQKLNDSFFLTTTINPNSINNILSLFIFIFGHFSNVEGWLSATTIFIRAMMMTKKKLNNKKKNCYSVRFYHHNHHQIVIIIKSHHHHHSFISIEFNSELIIMKMLMVIVMVVVEKGAYKIPATSTRRIYEKKPLGFFFFKTV